MVMNQNVELETEEASYAWKTKVLVIGAVVGALVGLGSAYLMMHNAEKSGRELKVTTGEGGGRNMSELKALQCVPCRGGEPTVTEAELQEYLPQIPEWMVVERDGIKRLEKRYKFKNFREALTFTNQVGE